MRHNKNEASGVAVTNFAPSLHQSSRLCDPESAELAAPDGFPKSKLPMRIAETTGRHRVPGVGHSS
jgi:hypothetical protein